MQQAFQRRDEPPFPDNIKLNNCVIRARSSSEPCKSVFMTSKDQVDNPGEDPLGNLFKDLVISSTLA